MMKEILKGEIRKIEGIDGFNAFGDVFKAYSSFPYYEEWTTKEIHDEYEFNLKNGFIFGCYYDNVCVGFVSMCPATMYKHPLNFKEPSKVLYISNLVVKFNYRYHGFGTALAEFAVNFAKENNYEAIYFRYRETHEFGKRIAKKLGFTRDYDACEVVTISRTTVDNNSHHKGSDLRFFMTKEL